MPLVKPAPWAVNRAAVDERYRDLWRGLRIAVVWPDTETGLAYNLVTKELGTLEGADLGRGVRPLGSVWTRSTITQGSHIDIPFQIDPSTTPFTAVGVLHVDALPGDEINLHQHDGTGTGRNWILYDDTPATWGTFLGGDQLSSTVSAEVGELNMVVVRFDGGSTMVVGANGDWSNTVDSSRTPESATGDHIWMDHKAVDQAPASIPGYSFYVWDRELSDVELDSIYPDPFGLVRPAAVQQTNPVSSLLATGDGTIVDVVNESDAASPLEPSVDDDPASPDDADWVNNAIDLSGGDASVFFDVTDLPTDFGNAESATVEVRAQGVDISSTLHLYVQIFQSDETTPMSDEVEAVAVAADDTFTNYLVSLTGLDTTSGKSTWDNARIRFRWSTT